MFVLFECNPLNCNTTGTLTQYKSSAKLVFLSFETIYLTTLDKKEMPKKYKKKLQFYKIRQIFL